MSSGCCPWRCGRRSSPVGPEDGTTTVVRKTTKNGETVTTTTTYKNTVTIDIGDKFKSSSSLPTDSKQSNGLIREFNSKSTASTGHQFEVECLNEHNRLRALHGCPPLKLSNKLSGIAKKWAINMADRNSMNHSKTDYGENLYMCSGFSINGAKAVESWYNEIKDYSFRNPVFSMKTGHFTQVVWKESKELGVGVEIRGNSTWVVANYNPPGNVQGMFEQNVPRLLRS